MPANTSRNPFSVSLGTFTAEIPCNHWRSAETSARGASTWQGSSALLGASGGLSTPISAANQSGRLTLWVSIEFSLLLALILLLILVINSLASLCHSRRVLARLDDTVSAGSCDHLVAAQLATDNAAQFLTLSVATVCDANYGLRFASHSTALVSIT